jgi:ABC-2 type transport system permease protein
MGNTGKAGPLQTAVDAAVLFCAFSKVAFLTQLEFRVTYAVRMLGKVLSFGGGFAIIAILLNRFKTIGDWSTWEILFLYSMNIFSYSAGATFTMPFNNLSSRINRGMIDAILTKPVNPMLFYMCQNVSAGYTSNYVISIGIMALSLSKLQLAWNLPLVIHLVLSILGGTFIHAAALIASGVPAFWLVKATTVTDILYSDLARFVDYPLSIYSRFIQVLLTFVLPYAFINFYPAQVFLGKNDSLFVPMVSYLTPVMGALCFFLAYRFWEFGLRAYQSTGS